MGALHTFHSFLGTVVGVPTFYEAVTNKVCPFFAELSKQSKLTEFFVGDTYGILDISAKKIHTHIFAGPIRKCKIPTFLLDPCLCYTKRYSIIFLSQ